MPDNGWRRRATESGAPSRHHGGLSATPDSTLTSPLHQLTAREIQVLKLVVDAGHPTPSLGFLRGLSRVFAPASIREVAGSIRPRGPGDRRNVVDHIAQLLLPRAQALLALFALNCRARQLHRHLDQLDLLLRGQPGPSWNRAKVPGSVSSSSRIVERRASRDAVEHPALAIEQIHDVPPALLFEVCFHPSLQATILPDANKAAGAYAACGGSSPVASASSISSSCLGSSPLGTKWRKPTARASSCSPGFL